MNQKDPWVRMLLVLLVFIAISYVGTLLWEGVQHFSTVILLFLFAWLIAFMLNPLVNLLTVHDRIPRIIAIAIVYLALICLAVLASILIVPVLATQLAQLGANFPAVVEQAPPMLQNTQSWLAGHDISIDLSTLYQQQSLIQRAESLGTGLAQNALGIAQGILSSLFNGIIVIILSFYITVDGGNIATAIIDHLPSNTKPIANYFSRSVERTFGGYMLGAFIQAMIYGFGTWLVMVVFGLSYSVAVGVFAGVMLVIPFVGSFVALIPPLIIAGLSGSLSTFLFVAIGLLVLQQIVLNIVAPKVMSENVGIHPLLVFLSVLIGAQEAGVIGAILGVPVAAVVYSMLIFFIHKAETGEHDNERVVNELTGDSAGKAEQTQGGIQ